MISPTLVNKFVGAVNDLRLKMIIVTRSEEDRKNLNVLFDIAIKAVYAELRSQRRGLQHTDG